jgi:hypothetical protein
MRTQFTGRALTLGYLLLAALLTLALGLFTEDGWRSGLLLAGMPWTGLAALALDGVGLVQLPFVLAWETVFALIGAAAVALNAWLLLVIGRKVARAWRRTPDEG